MVTARYTLSFVLALLPAANVNAFRSCGSDISSAYSAATRYTVGEIDFDDISGLAAGTETTYNYTNSADDTARECHVTYELSGTYVPGVEVLVLDATRTNYSPSCPSRTLEMDYPPGRLYSLQLELESGGRARVSLADSGEFVALGTWGAGRAVYKTEEKCTYF
jgi:hypothetical protein